MALFKLFCSLAIGFVTPFAFSAKATPCERKFDVGLANYPPLSYREDGRISGLAHDLTRELARRTGCTFSETDYFRPTAVKLMASGRIDLFFLASIGAEFSKVGDFQRLYTSGRILIVTQDVGSKHKTIDEFLKDKTIKFGIIIGSRPAMTESEESALIKAGRTVTTTDPENLFQMLRAKRIQAILYPTLSAGYFIKKLNLEEQTVQLIDPSKEFEVGFISSKRRMTTADLQLINSHLAEMKKDGTFMKILLKYVDEKYTPRKL